MRKLDRSRHFGKISPPYHREDFDRPAFYEQDGIFFDQHDREIIPGQPLQQIVPHEPGQVTKDEDEKPAEQQMTPGELLRRADTRPWAHFRKEARRILGPSCPASKEEIKVALQNAIAEYQARMEARRTRAANPAPQQPVQRPAQQPSAPAVQQAGSTGVDLAAWARGQREYLFGDIRKAFREQYHKVVTERRDALDFLIEQGVITAEEARQDIT